MDDFEAEWSNDEAPAKTDVADKVVDSAVADKAKGDAEFSAAFTADDDSAAVAPAAVVEPKAEAKPAEPAKPLSFKQTFAAQRAAGAKTFDWNGKKYTTELAKPKAKPVVKAAPVAAPSVAKAPAPPAQKTTLAPSIETERKPLPLASTDKATVDITKQTGLGSLKF